MSTPSPYDGRAEERLIALLRVVLAGEDTAAISDESRALSPLTEAEEERLYLLSKSQDLSHLILPAAERIGLSVPSPYAEKYNKQTFLALYRDERMTAALSRVGDALSAAKIPYLPLKGAVMRTLYPETWQRTSCDMDILVHEEDLDRAVRALETVGYTAGKRIFHDVHLESEDGLLLELHFSIGEGSATLDPVLAGVWENAAPEAEGSFCYRMNSAFFLFHLLAHMAYHFSSGGCGVRPFMDVFLYRRSVSFDEEKLSRLLGEASLTAFSASVFRLCDAWFSDAPYDDLCRRMESFLFRGGIYGTKQQGMAVNRAKKGGKIGFLFRRLFPPFRILSARYPVLKKHPWLTPLFHVRRWFSLLGKEARERSIRSWKIMQSVDEKTVDDTKDLIEKLGL